MKEENKTKIIIAAIVAFAVVVLFFIGKDDNLGRSADQRSCGTASTTAYSIGDDVSTSIATARTRICGRLLTNNSAEDVYLSFGSDAATVGGGMLITASSTLEINADNLYRGAIQAITSVASSTLIVTEFTY